MRWRRGATRWAPLAVAAVQNPRVWVGCSVATGDEMDGGEYGREEGRKVFDVGCVVGANSRGGGSNWRRKNRLMYWVAADDFEDEQ